MLRMTPQQMQAFGQAASDRWLDLAARDLKQDFAAELVPLSPTEVRERIRPVVQAMRSYGFDQGDHLYQLAAWGLFYGFGFEDRLAGGEPRRILEGPEPPARRFQRLKACLATLQRRNP